MTNGTPVNPKIIIGSDEQSCRATPGELFTNPGSTVIFDNIGRGQVTVLFPEDSPVSETSFDIKEGEQHSVTITTKQKLLIPYDVYNHNNRALASDEQRPIIIVYPDFDR